MINAVGNNESKHCKAHERLSRRAVERAKCQAPVLQKLSTGP